jgi:hypothetical protein
MKKLILLSGFFILIACQNESPPLSKDPESFKYGDMKIRVIDSCEYIEYDYGITDDSRVYTLTHKGNCKFCKARQ